MTLIGANPNPAVLGGELQPGHVNYLRGNDPSEVAEPSPTYAQVRYQEVYAGIDLVLYGRDGSLEYDFVVKPGARPEAIEIAFEGVEDIRMDGEGVLGLGVSGSELRQRPPTVYQIREVARRRFEGGTRSRVETACVSRSAATTARVIWSSTRC